MNNLNFMREHFSKRYTNVFPARNERTVVAAVGFKSLSTGHSLCINFGCRLCANNDDSAGFKSLTVVILCVSTSCVNLGTLCASNDLLCAYTRCQFKKKGRDLTP